MSERCLSLFEGYGIELEWMIVDSETLSVKPISDQVLRAVAGTYESEVEVGQLAWSNELVLHVIELKTNGPAPSLDALPELFHAHALRINDILEPLGARLMPTAMHPWMDPMRETRLWPHEHSPIYEAYNRIFGCQGHGWSNLQSIHINLPFCGDDQFGRLHAAIRLILPILPAIAASSPIVDGRLTGMMDQRLEVYRTNSSRIPSVTGSVVPEAVYTRADYDRYVFEPMYRDIAPYDPQGELQHEFLNSRGAIARFDRSSIEIRVLDVQECPQADLAICAAVVAVLQALVEQRWTSTKEQMQPSVGVLAKPFFEATRDADYVLLEPWYTRLFGFPEQGPAHARDLWAHLIDSVVEDRWRRYLDIIVNEGPLSRRLVAALGPTPSRSSIEEVYRSLCGCLAGGEMFRP